MPDSYRLGIDVGGTFTDAVLLSEHTGELHIAKVPSTPEDPSVGFITALTRVVEKTNLDPESIAYLVHGTTVATNALIEAKTPKTAFITTAGFGDMLEIARQVRPSLYDVHFTKPRPLVPRNLAYEVQERLDAGGHVLIPFDAASVIEIARQLKKKPSVPLPSACSIPTSIPIMNDASGISCWSTFPGLSSRFLQTFCPSSVSIFGPALLS